MNVMPTPRFPRPTGHQRGPERGEEAAAAGPPDLFGKGMEAMRRMILMALGLGLLGAAVGCNHTAGFCDCEKHCGSVLQAEPPAAPGTPAPVLHAEPIAQPPHVLDK